MLSFGVESFVFQFAVRKYEDRVIILPVFCVGVKLGLTEGGT